MGNTNASIKKLSKAQLVDLDLNGQIHGARFDLLNLQSLRKAKENDSSERASKFPRFNLFNNWFGEVDLLEGNSINITFFGPYYDLQMAMQVYGLRSTIQWDFTETPVSQLEDHKAGRLEIGDLIGIYRNSTPIPPTQESLALILKMTSEGARKCVFGSMIEGNIKTLDKKKDTGMSYVMSMVYPNTLTNTLEKSTQMQKLIMIAELTVKIDDLKKEIFSTQESTNSQNQQGRKKPEVKYNGRKRKNGKSKRRARV